MVGTPHPSTRSISARSIPPTANPHFPDVHPATALWVTRRPSRGSDGSYGPCGPAWTGRPGRPRRPRDAADRRIPDGAPDGNRLESASNGGDKPAGLAPRGAHGVACAGLREGDGGPPGAGGGRAARPRPTPTPTFWPGARRVPRRAPGQSEPPGGLVRPLNTWPHDRHDSRRRSSLRSAVVTRDSPLRWPAVPGLASLPPLPITRLPIRVRQHHKTIATPLRNGPGNTPNTGPPARRPGRWRAGERVQLVVHREGDRPSRAPHPTPHPRVTRRPPRGSDSSYGPCGPAWTGASRPSTTIHETRRTVGLGIGARRVPRRASGPG